MYLPEYLNPETKTQNPESLSGNAIRLNKRISKRRRAPTHRSNTKFQRTKGSNFSMKSNRFPKILYWLLLLYVVAALLFWGFSLQRQSRIIYEAERRALPLQLDSNQSPELYRQQLAGMEERRLTRTKQYYGEGSTFLLIILMGAAVVYSAIRRSLRLSRQQSNFMLAVTHELKSPIAAVKLNLQTIQKRRLTEAQQTLLVERCVAETNRLNDLCNNLLLASRLESEQYQQAKEAFSFSQLLEETLDNYNSRYPGRFIEQISGDCRVVGDQLMLQMVVTNLLENAIKYSPADTPIQVSLSCRNGQALLEIADEGIGIPDEEKSQIFEKFYRVGSENTRRTKGTGLGLYITKRIVLQHRGQVSVRNNSPQGSVFEIRLPLA